jgi:hypothetical protein
MCCPNQCFERKSPPASPASRSLSFFPAVALPGPSHRKELPMCCLVELVRTWALARACLQCNRPVACEVSRMCSVGRCWSSSHMCFRLEGVDGADGETSAAAGLEGRGRKTIGSRIIRQASSDGDHTRTRSRCRNVNILLIVLEQQVELLGFSGATVRR